MILILGAGGKWLAGVGEDHKHRPRLRHTPGNPLIGGEPQDHRVQPNPLVAQVERMLLAMLEPLEAHPEDIREIAVAGNTAMAASFIGSDLLPLASAPYEGVSNEATYASAETVGLSRFPLATCYVLPGISAFVGPDVVAGLLATAPDASAGPVLFLDLGTNGELALVTESGVTATSAAAGHEVPNAIPPASTFGQEMLSSRISM
ncbi:MAG: hypothetical protein CVU24_17300, partial [Betaproteobacteria bacterium HGW-Betaproteobacteria-18]